MPELRSPYLIGVDLADAQDYTAITILEKAGFIGSKASGWREIAGFYADSDEGGWAWPEAMSGPDAIALQYANENFGRPFPQIFRVRHAERLVRGSGYPLVEERLMALMYRLKDYQPVLLVDKTGVGAAPLQYMRNSGLEPIGIHFHQGQKVNYDKGNYNVPVVELVHSAQIVAEQRRLEISPNLSHAEDMKQELRKFRRKIDKRTAHESFSAWRERDHDDLVFSLAMCTWFHTYHFTPLERDIQQRWSGNFGPPPTPEREKSRLEKIRDLGRGRFPWS